MSTFKGFLKEYPFLAIDYFKGKCLDPSVSVYFLSHCHQDHMEGLNSPEFLSRLKSREEVLLYCSAASCHLLKNDEKYCHLEPYIVPLAYNEPTMLSIFWSSSRNETEIVVTLLPAGHCPGSAMILFEGPAGNVLYTGDFRLAVGDIGSISHLHTDSKEVKQIKSLYLDTTFCKPEAFYIPSRCHSLEACIELVGPWLDMNATHSVTLVCSAQYGYEHLFLGLHKRLGVKVFVGPKKFAKYDGLPDIQSALTLDPGESRIRCGMKRSRSVAHSEEDGHKGEDPPTIWGDVLKIKLSAMWYTQFVSIKEITNCLGMNSYKICYSTHSSLQELQDVVQYLKPDNIYPNVVSSSSPEQLLKWLLPSEDQSVEEPSGLGGIEATGDFVPLGMLKDPNNINGFAENRNDSEKSSNPLNFLSSPEILNSQESSKLTLSQSSNEQPSDGESDFTDYDCNNQGKESLLSRTTSIEDQNFVLIPGTASPKWDFPSTPIKAVTESVNESSGLNCPTMVVENLNVECASKSYTDECNKYNKDTLLNETNIIEDENDVIITDTPSPKWDYPSTPTKTVTESVSRLSGLNRPDPDVVNRSSVESLNVESASISHTDDHNDQDEEVVVNKTKLIKAENDILITDTPSPKCDLPSTPTKTETVSTPSGSNCSYLNVEDCSSVQNLDVESSAKICTDIRYQEGKYIDRLTTLVEDREEVLVLENSSPKLACPSVPTTTGVSASGNLSGTVHLDSVIAAPDVNREIDLTTERSIFLNLTTVSQNLSRTILNNETTSTSKMDLEENVLNDYMLDVITCSSDEDDNVVSRRIDNISKLSTNESIKLSSTRRALGTGYRTILGQKQLSSRFKPASIFTVLVDAVPIIQHDQLSPTVSSSTDKLCAVSFVELKNDPNSGDTSEPEDLTTRHESVPYITEPSDEIEVIDEVNVHHLQNCDIAECSTEGVNFPVLNHENPPEVFVDVCDVGGMQVSTSISGSSAAVKRPNSANQNLISIKRRHCLTDEEYNAACNLLECSTTSVVHPEKKKNCDDYKDSGSSDLFSDDSSELENGDSAYMSGHYSQQDSHAIHQRTISQSSSDVLCLSNTSSEDLDVVGDECSSQLSLSRSSVEIIDLDDDSTSSQKKLSAEVSVATGDNGLNCETTKSTHDLNIDESSSSSGSSQEDFDSNGLSDSVETPDKIVIRKGGEKPRLIIPCNILTEPEPSFEVITIDD